MGASSSPPGNRLFRGLSADERRSQRREQLIEAGLRAFGARGFHEVGVRDICAEARLTERYFYESFPNREALFLAVYERGVDRVRETVMAALQGLPPDEMPRAGLRAFLSLLRDEPLWPRIILIDVLTIGADVGAQSILATQAFADLIGGMVATFYADPSLDPRLVATGLVGSTIFLTMRWASNGFQEPLEQVLDHCAVFYDALRASNALGPLAETVQSAAS
jgi:AcrR family transcriptional regulator